MEPVVAVYLGDPAETAEWTNLLAPLLPGFAVQNMDDPGDPAAVRYAVVWAPPQGRLAQFVNLRAVVSVGAGIDHVLADPQFPRTLPILRTTGPAMVQRMREYVALHVLAHHRALAATDASQAARTWQPVVTPTATQRKVGIMGLGQMGSACAQTLVALGFDTAGWARNGCEIPGVQVYTGRSGLPAFLNRSEILVCLLPGTDETRDLLDRRVFDLLPVGAAIINAGRGSCLVEADLIDAIDRGHLSGATLDVFRTEPLPPEHPFWNYPAIRITPHIASMIDAATGAEVVASNIRRFEAGETLPDATIAGRGY